MHIEQAAASGTHPAIDLTRKGEAYAAAALAEADGVIFLVLDSRDRTTLAKTIDRLIGLLDEQDGDPDIEEQHDIEPALGWTGFGIGALNGSGAVPDDREWDESDLERTLGWENGSLPYDQTRIGQFGLDECENENEHGGDICDEPHDAIDEGNDEPALGWSERCGMWNDPDVQRMDNGVDPDDIDVVCGSGPLNFNGDGAVAARTVLRNLERIRPDVRQQSRHGWCGGDYSALRVEGLAIKSNKGRVRLGPDEVVIIRPGVAMIGGFR